MKEFIIILVTLFGVLDRISCAVLEAKSTETTLKEQLGDYDVYKKVISVPGAPKPIAPCNTAVQINYIFYLSGQVGIDPTTRRLVSDDVRNQTQQIFHNVKAILHAAGSDMQQIARCLVLLTDINDYQSVNEIYTSFFPSIEDYPARTTFAVKSLPGNAKIEIECTAYTRWSSRNQTFSNCYERLTFSSIFMLFGLVFYVVL